MARRGPGLGRAIFPFSVAAARAQRSLVSLSLCCCSIDARRVCGATVSPHAVPPGQMCRARYPWTMGQELAVCLSSSAGQQFEGPLGALSSRRTARKGCCHFPPVPLPSRGLSRTSRVSMRGRSPDPALAGPQGGCVAVWMSSCTALCVACGSLCSPASLGNRASLPGVLSRDAKRGQSRVWD
ncbi:uncharacterized protein B0H64DRAFT_4284 [Chaetomium fimeti]|uniref:Uncharacterized protein n=1 Tax=Chaetomium fimeti TaxID=1854472 RepID=A0AAE0HPG4_9PEZI|nr:hypothetical protein B0H64DRAFT_4284 [Chaetomium fimeti]